MELHKVRPRSVGYFYICLFITIEFKTFEGHCQKSLNSLSACRVHLVATPSAENSPQCLFVINKYIY